MVSKRSELRITDPRALRALAHPARQRLITELFSGEVLTATEAAELVDLTPSATSYHLRALEKFGIVVREEAATDARQRPWRAVADSISIQPQAYQQAGVAADANMARWVADIEAGIGRLNRAMASDHLEVGRVSHGRLWLTWEELQELGDRMSDLTEEYRDRTRSDHPEGARAWESYVLMLPEDEIE